MDKSRNYILDRITSKKISIEEFNFDKLTAPPLSWFFSPFDIQELHDIAHSLRYSARPKEKYQAIDRVCNKLGLIKFGAGTNRVVYRHPEFPDILFKIAADDVGLGDNPAEFRNQFLLKPFVAKCFEISPCGTVAIVERVVPITSREEFISVADDVFTLITEWIIGKYIMADIGVSYFQNIGIRKSFGVVLLDYPYLYELDGDKIYCKRKDPTSPTGLCDGEIDYDTGFDKLCCTKCGAIYRAKELEKKINDKEIIIKKEGDIKMNIRVKGGSKNLNKVISDNGINNDNFKDTENCIKITRIMPNREPEVVAIAREVKDEVPIEEVKFNRPVRRVSFNDNDDNDEFKFIPVADVVEESEVESEDEDKCQDHEEEPEVITTAEPEHKYVNGVSTTINPISFSDETKDKYAEIIDNILNKTPVDNIDNAVDTIIENLNDIEIDVVKDDVITRAFDALGGLLPTSADAFYRVIRLAYDILINLPEEVKIDPCNIELEDIFKSLYIPKVTINDATINGRNIDVTYSTAIYSAEDEDNTDKIIEYVGNNFTIEDILPDTEIGEDASEPETPVTKATTNYNGIEFYHAKIVDVKDLLPREQRQNIIVFTDDNGRYIDIDGKILAGYTIDDLSVQNVTLVSKKWVDQVTSIIEQETTKDVEVNNAPVGALPESGITNEEFLANLEAEDSKEE